MFNSFIDSNIWIYAFVESEKEKKKTKITRFLEDLTRRSKILTSIQVLNEFHWVLKRKYKIDESIIRDKGLNGILQVTGMHVPSGIIIVFLIGTVLSLHLL